MSIVVPFLQRHRALVFCTAVAFGIGVHSFTATRVDWGEVIATVIIVTVTNLLKPVGGQ
jgi:hypothetical protein